MAAKIGGSDKCAGTSRNPALSIWERRPSQKARNASGRAGTWAGKQGKKARRLRIWHGGQGVLGHESPPDGSRLEGTQCLRDRVRCYHERDDRGSVESDRPARARSRRQPPGDLPRGFRTRPKPMADAQERAGQRALPERHASQLCGAGKPGTRTETIRWSLSVKQRLTRPALNRPKR